ncbi:MAG: PAS domain S-box protein [Pseudolabrys sp.]|nr:PAS domain S-box protein [Pseudolabrys sp.]
MAKMADAFERVLPAKLRAAMTRLSTRLTIAMVAMVVITAAVIEIVIFHGIESALLPRERERIDAQVRLLAADFDSYVGGARADVRSFIAAAALDGIIRARQNGGIHPDDGTSEMIWRRRLAGRLVAEVKAKPLYQQFRIIGFADGGLELVRVDRSGPGNTVRAVPADELQRKGDTDYLKAIAKTRQGELFISKINYNREYEKIKLPPVPVLRVASPLFTDRGVLFGALIINMDMRPIFARIRGSQATGEGVFVVNEKGDYLLNPDRVKEFGFEYGAPRRVQDDYPVFGSLLTSDGVWEDTFSGPTGRDLVAAGVRVKFGENAGVAIAKVVPYSNIMAPIWSIGYSALLGGLAIAIGAVILAIVIAGSLTRPLRQMITAVKAFGRNEPMTVPLAAGGEIGLLARAFERMVVDIGEKTSLLDRETEERRRIFESSLDLIMVVDRKGTLIRVSPSSMSILGYQPDEMVGQNASKFLHPADLERTRIRMRQLRRGRKMQNYEICYLHKDGRTVTMAWAGVWSEPENKYFYIGRDVTEQRFAEELFRMAVEASPSGMLMIDHSGRIVMINNEFEKLFGYKREELMGELIEKLVPTGLQAGHKKRRVEYQLSPESRSMGKKNRLYGLRKDGSQFPVEIGLHPIDIREGTMILGVVVDISERLRNERLKNEFVSTVSHELRTPLTSISASLALLLGGKAGTISAPATRLVSIAHSNGQRLVRLINDILDIEKIESGKMNFTIKRVDVLEVVEQAIETSQAYADECGIRLVVSEQTKASDVRADADRLAQVATNLLSNAIKFSPRGEEVIVAVSEHQGVVRISVRDHGVGVPEEFKPRIFDKFAQADSSDTRKKGGTGLGLSIVRQIVARLGGDVGFESSPDMGSLFYVDLPRWHSAVDGPESADGSGGRAQNNDGNKEVA